MKKNKLWLQFACECVSSRSGYTDPWAGVAQNRLLPAGAKEQIINLTAEKPMTIAQIAKRLGLSQPSVHAHVSELVESELIREATDIQKQYPAEKYYQPNFPVITAEDAAIFESEIERAAAELTHSFESHLRKIRKQFEKTSLSAAGWTEKDISQYLFAKVQREARKALESNGTLDVVKPHRNGATWLFWAEEDSSK